MRLGVLAIVAACGEPVVHTTDIRPTLIFADRSDEEISRLLLAALGADVNHASQAFEELSTKARNDTCPILMVQGGITTLEGGCTTADGTLIGGRASLGPHGFDFDVLTVDGPGSAGVYSGPADEHGGVGATLAVLKASADLTETRGGIVVRSDLAFQCPSDHACDNQPECNDCGCGECQCLNHCTPEGSGLELGDVGGALVSGSWVYWTTYATRLYQVDLSLEGVDTITAHHGSNSCLEWQIVGTDRTGIVATCQ